MQRISNKRKKVYVVCGPNEALRDAMYQFLRALGLQPIEKEVAISWTGESSPFIGRIIDAAFEHAQAIVVLFVGEDAARLSETYWKKHDTSHEKMFQLQPGPDQIFEAGYAFGKAPERTILVQIGTVKLFSDIEGRHIPHFTGTAQDRQSLKMRLIGADCDVDDTGSSWLREGNFQDAID